jgi:OOP family OmpA-OmpF porin
LTFVTGSDELTPESRTVRPVLAQRIASAPAGTRFEIRTHTDSAGDADYNQWLSEQRAAAVCDGLIHAGVPRDRLTIVGVGESSPLVAPETTEADRAANRRVEVVPLS